MKARHSALLPALAAAALLVGPGTPAVAQERAPRWGAYDVRNEAYDNGYRRGYRNGADDSRDRRPAEFRREHDYRDGDWGYDRRFGSKDAYKRMFREGFEAGYMDGYRGRGWSRSERPFPPAAGYGYPDRDDRRYESRGYGSYGTYGTYRNGSGGQIAFNYGYNDGYDRGMKAARDRKAFDPNREGWYRDGDRHYDSDYGPRDQYRAAYRDGFLRGYDEGYRGTGYYRR